jgi:ankyrin repeat protein
MARKKKTIFDVIQEGDRAKVARFLAGNPDALGERDQEGLSPLMRAVYEGKAEIVELVLSKEPELDVFEAAALGRVDPLERLLKRSAKRATAFSKDGFTALHLAAYFGRPEAARLLLERGADVHARSKNSRLPTVQPLHSAAAGRQTEVARLLLEHGADPNATQAGGWTPLHSAAANGNVDLVRLLLECGADPKKQSDDRTPPVEFAIENRHYEVVSLLRGA